MLRPCGWGPVPVPGNTRLFAFWVSVSCLCRERLQAKGPSGSLSSALLPQTTAIELGKLRPRERQELPLCGCRRSKHVVGAPRGPMFSYLGSLERHSSTCTPGPCIHVHTMSPTVHTLTDTSLFFLCACAPPPAGTGFEHRLRAICCASLPSTIMLTGHHSSRTLSAPRRSSGQGVPWVPVLAPPSICVFGPCPYNKITYREESPLPSVLHLLVHPVPLTNPYRLFQGNDQVRFELTCYSLAPQIKVRGGSSPGEPWEQDREEQ